MQTGEVACPITYEQYKANYEKQISLRKQNFDKEQEMDFMFGSNKTAAIKTIQKFISKFKMENKNQQSILAEMDTLNLSKYTDQISNIIVNSLTQKDIPFYTQVATKLNKEYKNFPAIIIDHLKKLFTTLWQSSQDNKNRLRAVLIFTTELFVCGFTFSYKEVRDMLIKIFKSGNKKKNSLTTETEKKLFAFYYNIQCFVIFLVNYYDQFTNLKPRWIQDWKQQNLEVKDFPAMLPLSQKEQLSAFFLKYISECQNVLEQNIELLKQYQNQLKDNLRMEGEFNKQNQKRYLNLIEKFNITKNNLRIICMCANKQFNEQKLTLQIDDPSKIMKSYVNVASEDAQIFQNQFEKEIYQNLPKFQSKNAKQLKDLKEAKQEKDKQDQQQLKSKQPKNSTDGQYRQFKQQLQKCKNITDSNFLAQLFESYNSKKNRKLLVRDILEFRKQYHLVTPFLCRVAAIVNQQHKDVMETVNESLFAQYEKLKNAVSTNYAFNDKKSRNWKYLCEFTKFQMIDSEKLINCLHNLIQDLKGHNIQLLILSLENVGRYLYLSPSSANKFTFFLNKLENVLKQKSFPVLTHSRLVNTMALIKPVQQSQAAITRQLSKEEKQANIILDCDITGDIDEMLKNIEKFISRSQLNLQTFNNCFFEKILTYDFIGNYNYAFIMNQLQNDNINKFIIDKTTTVLFDSLKKYDYQKCLILSRFLGQLYKYELLKKSFLYFNMEEILKIQGNQLGVINAICTILQTCVGYLDTSKKTIAQNQKFRFLYKFKKYIQNCKYIPMMQEFKITDVFELYRQKYLCNLKIEYLDQFMLVFDGKKDKQGKELNLPNQFDRYLEKKNFKEKKVEKGDQQEIDDRKRQNQNFIDEEDMINKKNRMEVLKYQDKRFQNQFNSTLTSNIKDLSGKIAKPAFIQKNIFDKTKDKKKAQEPQKVEKKVIKVIGRSGNKFIRKDVIIKDEPQVKLEEKIIKKQDQKA